MCYSLEPFDVIPVQVPAEFHLEFLYAEVISLPPPLTSSVVVLS